jgi:osmotically-inducible protein OsmY
MNNRNYNRGGQNRQNENYRNRPEQHQGRVPENSPEWRDEEEYYRSGESRLGSGGHQLFQGGDFGRGFSGGDYEGSLGTYGGHGAYEGANDRPYGHDDRTGYESSFQNRGRKFTDRGEYRGGPGDRHPSRFGDRREDPKNWGPYVESERGYDMRSDERGWWDKASDEVSSWMGDEEAARRRETDHRRHAIHRGRGPKGYTRSDDRIKEDVNDRLTDYAYLDASNIDVDVTGGEVVLTGTVESRYAKRMAEDIAEDVSGVRNVENRLRISGNGSAYSDASETETSKSFAKKA